MIMMVSLWLALVSQVLPRQSLQGATGTVLVALGGTGSPAVTLLCLALAITLSGFAAIRAGGVLGNQLRDLPLARAGWGKALLPGLRTVAGLLLILGSMHSGSTNLTQSLSIGGGLGIPVGCWIVPALILRQARQQRPGTHSRKLAYRRTSDRHVEPNYHRSTGVVDVWIANLKLVAHQAIHRGTGAGSGDLDSVVSTAMHGVK